MFCATWDDTGNVGLVNLTKAELEEFTTSTSSDKGKHIIFILINAIFIGILHIFRSKTRNNDGNG